CSYRDESKTVKGWLKRMWRLAARGHLDYASRLRPLVTTLKCVHAVSAGNPHLAHFASRYCSEVAVIPTVVDGHRFAVKTHSNHRPTTIGWYGSPDNHWYLNDLAAVFTKLKQVFGNKVQFAVISSRQYEHPGISFQWIPWHAQSELEDIL